MADLDDFFAKKDRKKNKTTKKFSTTEDVAKKLEDNAKKTEKVKKERVPEGEDNTLPAHVSTNTWVQVSYSLLRLSGCHIVNCLNFKEQDEWKDFEEEKKDYTGLKIGNLTIQSPTEGSGGAKESVDEQQPEVDFGQDSEKKVGPWKRIDAAEVQEEPKAVVEENIQQPPQKQSYVAPNFRNSGQPPVSQSRHKSKVAPDIHNEEYFPTLSKTSDHKK